jgi:3-hydroxyisobutyrate dehydrogenase-like beta-hydroxyacid dehydrogenase
MPMKDIGILGFGEAGSAFARQLAGGGACVSAYDEKFEQSGFQPAAGSDPHLEQVRFVSLTDLLKSSDIILSTVTTDAALAVARNCVSGLRPGQYYCDLNSTAPSVKIELAGTIAPTGAFFVEGAILGAIGVTGGRTQILLGGSHARNASELLNGFGLQTAPYSPEIGKASAFKLLRSIFSKGLEALLIEFLIAARAAGLQEDLWQEVTTLFSRNRFEDVASNWVCSHAVAHERRFHEMVQVADLLKEMSQDALMTDATVAFFERSTDLKLSEDFRSRPDQMDDVIDALLHRISRRP